MSTGEKVFAVCWVLFLLGLVASQAEWLLQEHVRWLRQKRVEAALDARAQELALAELEAELGLRSPRPPRLGQAPVRPTSRGTLVLRMKRPPRPAEFEEVEVSPEPHS